MYLTNPPFTKGETYRKTSPFDKAVRWDLLKGADWYVTLLPALPNHLV